MQSAQTSLILLGSLVAVILVARNVRRHLPEHHLSADSKEGVKLAMGLVATMTALLLGLLVSSAKGTYDTQRSEVIQLAGKVSFLGRLLKVYGPETAEARALLLEAVTESTQRMWPEETKARPSMGGSLPSGEAFYAAIARLSPKNELQQALKAQGMSVASELGQLRMLLLAQMVPSVSKALLIAVSCWLLILFLCFSLLAPPNATTTLSMIAAAVSVAGAVFLVLELDQPLGGLIRISGAPMQSALSQLAP